MILSAIGELEKALKSQTFFPYSDFPNINTYGCIALYAFPPDAQAEIAKRDARIKELEGELQSMSIELTSTNQVSALNARIKELEQYIDDAAIYANEQASEISRLVKERDDAYEALSIKPDANTLKAHDDALIERCAEV